MSKGLVPLRDIAEIEVGYAFKSSEFSSGTAGVRLLRGDNIAPGSVRWDRTERWPETASVAERYQLQGGDIVLAMDRPWVGGGLKFARVRDIDLPAYLVQRVARIRASEGINQDYLSAVIGDQAFTDYILSVQTGTSIPHISSRQIGAFELRLHESSEQDAIAGVSQSLVEKIAANTKLVATADQLSHSLFLSMSRSDSQLVPLSETAKFVNGRAFTKNASGTGRVVIRISELNSGIGGSTVFNDIDVDEQHLATPGDLLFAWSGSLTLHRWFRPEAIVNQHIFKVIPNDGYPHWLVHELLRHKLEEFKSIAADKATTMGHIQRKHLDELVAVPPSEEIHEHDDLMSGLWGRALAAEVENLKLAATRDALLPQLMSGRIRVRDAEKVLEDAGV
ncbi:type I restriction enzyme S subunit [Arthrobacter sp. PvP102]|uniref:hypothetical protein n=1 Tax=unclassified Arthrobacter TaxID=235627 RepID=UPI001AE42380|nr:MULTISPECIES: hypothetical protein [unclassified Arthrobacter]MBP1231652.1 type I restriction enzyme S subunit [Arthrobacter sp. PvP103]MBP1236787.1 type I restriction enzyme S subunit [Arthrobacter sp. PvP102]